MHIKFTQLEKCNYWKQHIYCITHTQSNLIQICEVKRILHNDAALSFGSDIFQATLGLRLREKKNDNFVQITKFKQTQVATSNLQP